MSKYKNNYWNINFENPTNFIFGYGSIINDISRNKTCRGICDAIPVRLNKKFGYRRSWKFRNVKNNSTVLGVEKVNNNEASTINGVIFLVSDYNLKNFDERENGYIRVKIPINMLESCSLINLPPKKSNISIWIYVPKKHKLKLASKKYPCLQSYLDICLEGCLKYGAEFTHEFINTIYEWNDYWINDTHK
jgi:hypothetical protein